MAAAFAQRDRYTMGVIRSIRALFLFWRLFLSYGLQWVLQRLLGERVAARGQRVHALNARRLADGFMRLRGVFIKLGQVLSVIGGFLPAAYGRELERLQDKVPAHPFHAIVPRLEKAWGADPLRRFDYFEQTALAAASLAQVHRARFEGRDVAVKILYPEVRTLVRRDLAVLRTVEPVLRRVFGLIHTGRVLAQLTDMLAHETDYLNERANILRMAELFADEEGVVVPSVVDELSDENVLVMSFEAGVKITDRAALKTQDIEAEAVADTLVEAFLRMLFTGGVFHADPHPGNFLVRPADGRLELVILDYGAVEDVTDDLVAGMRMVVMGAMASDDEQVLAGVERMGFVAEDGDREMLAQVGREYLKTLKGVRIDDFSKVDQDAMRKMSGFDQARGKIREIMRNVRYPDGFFYVERTLIMLFGLVAQLAPKRGLPGVLMPMAPRIMMGAFGDAMRG